MSGIEYSGTGGAAGPDDDALVDSGSLVGLASKAIDGLLVANARYRLSLYDINNSVGATLQGTLRQAAADVGSLVNLIVLADGADNGIVDIDIITSATRSAFYTHGMRAATVTVASGGNLFAGLADGFRVLVSAGTLDTGSYSLRKYPL